MVLWGQITTVSLYFILCYIISSTGVKKYGPCRGQFVQSHIWYQNYIILPTPKYYYWVEKYVLLEYWSQMNIDFTGTYCFWLGGKCNFENYVESCSLYQKCLSHLTTVPINCEYFYLPPSTRLKEWTEAIIYMMCWLLLCVCSMWLGSTTLFCSCRTSVITLPRGTNFIF